jgi:hypothetical protein
VIAEAIDTAELVILGALLWAGALGAAVALVIAAVIVAGIPLGIWARLPRPRRRVRRRPAGAPRQAADGHTPAHGYDRCA